MVSSTKNATFMCMAQELIQLTHGSLQQSLSACVTLDGDDQGLCLSLRLIFKGIFWRVGPLLETCCKVCPARLNRERKPRKKQTSCWSGVHAS